MHRAAYDRMVVTTTYQTTTYQDSIRGRLGGDEIHERVEQRARGVMQRYTPGRRAIVELLVSSGHPLSIGEIAEQLPDLPRSSAYRHLVDLQRAGAVRRVAAGDEFARFELAEDLTEHHHHLICSACGRVADVAPGPAFERSVRSTVEQLAAAEGFEVHEHRLDIVGLCAECQRAAL